MTAFAPSTPLFTSSTALPTLSCPLSTSTPTNPPYTPTARRHRRWVCHHYQPLHTATNSSTPQPSPTPTNRPPGRSPDYYANVGAVIDSIRVDYPTILEKERHLEHFRRDITFSDGAGGRVSGIDAYRALLWVLRAQTRFLFADAAMEIHNIFHDDRAGELFVRWRFSAAPRAWALATRTTPSPTVLDGMSIYRFDLNGLVREHQLESVVRRRGGAGVKVMFEEVLAVGTVSVGRNRKRVPVRGVPTWFQSVSEAGEFTQLPHREMVEVITDVEEKEDCASDESLICLLG